MNALLISLCIAVLIGIAVADEEHDCQVPAVAQCIAKFPIIESTNGSMPSAAYLDSNCDAMLEYLKCLSEALEECQDSSKKAHFFTVLDFLKDICDGESMTGEIYRENYNCIEENKEALQSCRRAGYVFVDKFMKEFGLDYDSIDDEEFTLVRCLQIMESKRCLKDILEESCDGDRVFTLLDSFIEASDEHVAECTPEVLKEVEEKVLEYLQRQVI